MEFKHISVLLNETIESLNIKPDGIYVDCTLGGGGHSYEIASRLKNGHLYGIDQDADAIEAASERLKDFSGNLTVIRDNFSNVKKLLSSEEGRVSGILADLGVSSHQFDEGDRGFSYRFDAPLDMRMDTRSELTAYKIVNEYPRERIAQILKDYGEEKFAFNIAKHIEQARANKPIETTFELNEIIKAAIPAKFRQTGHPSKQTFQALRIECNRELEVLKDSLDQMADLLEPGGRLCIITFHSLEDRIVKNKFREWENPCTCPKNFPVCVCGKKSIGKVITGKPIVASKEECEFNSRSHSAKLRVFEKA